MSLANAVAGQFVGPNKNLGTTPFYKARSVWLAAFGTLTPLLNAFGVNVGPEVVETVATVIPFTLAMAQRAAPHTRLSFR
ncbi:MAG: hypothetical protein AAGF71_04080 [Pseudomonadota bacterium]